MQTANKLWQKASTNIDQRIEAFTVGEDRDLDKRLSRFDILGSMAHITMLKEVELLTAEECEKLKQELGQLYTLAEQGQLEIETGIEDIHSQIELLLTRKLGQTGEKIHSARSRNDQVLVDLRLYFRAEIEQIVNQVNALFQLLQKRSREHKDNLMPGYTHLQEAMVSSFGLWFGAFAENLVDDLQLWLAAFKIINQNPLGSAAGYGSSLPINRQRTTELLGFDTLNYNVIHAQLGRGKTELQLSFAIASLAQTIGKLAMDICLFSNQSFGYVQLPDSMTTGSSIMPHKKNPDVFELLRARCNHLQALPQQVLMITQNLTSGYHRDFQLLKAAIFPALDELKSCLDICHYGIEHLQIKAVDLYSERYQMLFTVEAVNELVKAGIPFRQAYREVGQAVENGDFSYQNPLDHTHEGSLGNLCHQQIDEKFQEVVSSFDFSKIASALNQLLTV